MTIGQITQDNTSKLRLGWVLSIPEGNNQPKPIVHDVVMFLADPGDVAQALHADTGESWR